MYHRFTGDRSTLDEGTAATTAYYREAKDVLDEDSFQRQKAMGGLYQRSTSPLHAHWWEVRDKDGNKVGNSASEPLMQVIDGVPVLTQAAIEKEYLLYEITIDESSLTGPSTTTYTFSVAAHGEGGAVSKPTEAAVITEPNGAGDLVDGAITKIKLAPGCVTHDAIAAGSITADLLACVDLLAKGARVGSLSALGFVVEDSVFMCTRKNPGAQGDLTSEYNIFSPDGLVYEFHDLDGNLQKYVADLGEVYFGTNPYCASTANRIPGYDKTLASGADGVNYVQRLLKGVGADYKITDDNGEVVEQRDRDEYFHYIPSVFKTLADGTVRIVKHGQFLFKIANFVVTAVSSIIKGVFQVVSKENGRVLVTANPENEAQEGVGGHSVKINGDMNIGNNIVENGNIVKTGNVNVCGNMSVGGKLDAELSQRSLVMLADVLMPIGFVYVQYPDTLDPNTLYEAFGLAWDEITPNYAGDFFRAEGGDALAFGAGEQAEGLPNITGSFTDWYGRRFNGAFHQDWCGSDAHMKRGDNDYDFSGVSLDASRCSAVYGASNHVTPVNQSIRLWRRAKVVVIKAGDMSIAWTSYVPFMDELTSGDDIVPFVQLAVTDNSVTPPVITKSNNAKMTYSSGFDASSTTQRVVFTVEDTGIKSKLLPTDSVAVSATLTARAYRPMLEASDVYLSWTSGSAPTVDNVTTGDELTSLLTVHTTDGTIVQGVNIAYVDGFTANITTAQDITFRLTLPNSSQFRMPSEGMAAVMSVVLQAGADDSGDDGDDTGSTGDDTSGTQSN